MRIFSQRRFINILLLSALGVLAAIGLIGYKQAQRLREANAWVIHTTQVISVADQVIFTLTDAESRVTLYVVSGNKELIQRLPAMFHDALQGIAILKKVTADNPTQQLLINKLEPLVQTKMQIMQQIIAGYMQKGREGVLTIAGSQKRQIVKREIIQTIMAINQNEYNLLKIRSHTSQEDAKKGDEILFTTIVASEALLLLCLFLLNYHLSQRNRAERKRDEAEKKLVLSNQQLHESEERLVLATEGSNVGLWDWIPGTENVVYSPHFKRMLGYSEEEFPDLLQSFQTILHPADNDKLWSLVDAHLINHIPFFAEYRLKTKSGIYRWFQAMGQALWDQRNHPVRMLGSIIDITERKRAELELQVQYKIARILSEEISLEEASIQIIQAICQHLEWDIGTLWMADEQNKFLYGIAYWQDTVFTNRNFEKITRMTKFTRGVGLPGRVWASGKASWIVDVTEDMGFIRTEEAKELGLHSAFCFPILIQGRVLGIMDFYARKKEYPDSHLLDMMAAIGPQIGQFAQRKQAENDLRESETYKAAILKYATDGIITITEAGNIVSCNPQVKKIFGYAPEELLNEKIEILIKDISLQASLGASSQTVETIGFHKKGTQFPAEFTISKMIINKQFLFVIIIRDITERKKIEKLKSEFVSVVSHELRTPLTSVRGALGLILGGATGELAGKTKMLLDIANNNCERLLLLINDILDIEKIEAGKMRFQFQLVHIDKIVKEAIVNNELVGKKFGIQIHLQHTVSNIKVKVDTARLMQVLTNLLSNAVKFSQQGSEVVVYIEKLENKVRVKVSDKGIGIPDEFQAQIFQKFSQADASNTRGKGGTGLGLSISKAIIERLGGELNFYSAKGEGSTFYFDLPITSEERVIKPEIAKENAAQLKLLICEDDEDQAAYLSALLQASGFHVDIAANTAEARQLLDQNNYYGLILDLILPDQDGIAFIRELRSKEATRTLPVIVLSIIAHTGQVLLHGEAFSVIDWLDKPVNFDKLLNAIAQIRKKKYPNKPAILHVEDDIDTQQVVKSALEEEAYVFSVDTIKHARQLLKQQNWDLVILDLLLPDGNGVELLPDFAKSGIPVIVYSVLELDREYAKQVSQILMKSKTSKQELIEKIKNLLAKQK